MPKEPSKPVPEDPQPSLKEYATKEDFETLRKDIQSLSTKTSHHAPDDSMPPQSEYATVEDLNSLRKDIQYLTVVITGEPPSNPDEDDKEGEDEDEMLMQGEMIQPGELIIQDGSSTREAIYIKPKSRMYYDMTRGGLFRSYPGTEEPGPFDKYMDEQGHFKGSMSDFFNIIVDEFYIHMYYLDIGLQSVNLDFPVRMPVK
ncbi:unnamed protein product, partial [marine sediment metagenome]